MKYMHVVVLTCCCLALHATESITEIPNRGVRLPRTTHTPLSDLLQAGAKKHDSYQPGSMTTREPIPIPEGGRDYYAIMSSGETNDLRYLMTTLADRSIVGIALARSDLQAAGDRLAHIHPLRFLTTIFLDEQMKVAVRNIRDKPLIWNQLIHSVKINFEKELKVHNILAVHIDDFCQALGLTPYQFVTVIERQQWEHLLDLLITLVPRQGDYNRYDMRQKSSMNTKSILSRRNAASVKR